MSCLGRRAFHLPVFALCDDRDIIPSRCVCAKYDFFLRYTESCRRFSDTVNWAVFFLSTHCTYGTLTLLIKNPSYSRAVRDLFKLGMELAYLFYLFSNFSFQMPFTPNANHPPTSYFRRAYSI